MSLLVFVCPLRADIKDVQYFYKVKNRDTISTILFKLGFKPIYGDAGYLKKILKLNNRKDNADLVFPGDIIYFSLDQGQIGNSCFHVNAEFELIPTYDENCHNLMAKNANKSLEYIQRRYASIDAPKNNESMKDASPKVEIETTTAKETAQEEIKKAETQQQQQAPTNAPTVKQETTYGEFFFGIETSYSGLFGTDNSDGTTGELLSKFSPGYSFKWKQFWSDDITTTLGMRGHQFNIADTADNKIILNRENFIFNFNFGFNYKIHPRWVLSLETDAAQVPLYRGVATDTYKIDFVQRTAIGAKAEFVLMNRGPLSMSSYAQYGVLLYGEDSFYNPENGTYYGYGLNIYHRRKTYGLLGTVGYTEEETSVREVDFSYKYLNFNLGWVWTWSE